MTRRIQMRQPEFVKGIAIWFLIGLGSAQGANGGTYSLKLEGIRPVGGASCDDVAKSEGQRLMRFVTEQLGTPIELVEASCYGGNVGDDLPQWNIEIRYTADAMLQTVSTLGGYAADRPGYESLERCEASSEAERALFERSTKLPVFKGYCKVPMFKDWPWELNVMSFGSPQVRPITISANVFGVILGHNRDSFAQLMQNAFTKNGFDVAQVEVNHHSSYVSTLVRYYGSRLVRVEESTMVSFADAKECLSQVSVASEMLDQSGFSTFGVFCSRDMEARRGANLVAFNGGGDGFSLIQPQTVYESRDLCENVRESVIDHYKNQRHRDVKAGYCSLQDGSMRQYKIILVEKLAQSH